MQCHNINNHIFHITALRTFVQSWSLASSHLQNIAVGGLATLNCPRYERVWGCVSGWWTGVPLKVYSCLTPSVPGVGSGSTVSLTSIKRLLKMHGWMMNENYLVLHIPKTFFSFSDCWSELLPTLTRIDMPSLCFLGSTDRLIVIGGNNVETVVTSFCVETRKWGQIRSMEKTALIGQGTVFNEEVYMSGNQDMICRLNIHSLSLSTLPSLPVCTCYESFFHLFFWIIYSALH